MAVIKDGGSSVRRPTTPPKPQTPTTKPATTTESRPATSTGGTAAQQARQADGFERRNGPVNPYRAPAQAPASTSAAPAGGGMLGFLSSANASSAQSSSATSSSAQPAASEHVYTVQSGDSRQLILNKLGVGESQWNKLGDQATIHTKNGQEIPYSQAYVLKPGDQVVFKGALADKINGSKAPAEQKTANSTATPDTAAPAQAAAQTTPTTTNINQPPPGFGGGRWNNIPLDDRQAIWNDYNKSQQTAGAQGTTGTQSTPGTGQVDLSTMTQEQQYNYFKDLVESQGGTWKEGAEANIIGVRSLQDGKPVEGEGNVYDDTIFVCRMVDGEPQVESFTASTDAGAFDPIAAVTNADGTRKTDDKGNELSPYGGTDNDGDWGVSHLADGFYEDTWKIGDVPLDDKGLRQSGDIQVNFDNNYDGVISEDERDNQTKSSGWGIQFHPGGSGEHVNGYSAGCQVIKEQEYARFKEILTEQENAGQTAFSYLLIDSSNLPPTGESPPPTPGRNIPE